ncbi:MAG: hypothetical protein FWH39_01170, partial [Bacteroidales bacterium]|nr:hypothetical protein [Bacteroidales bacterium]
MNISLTLSRIAFRLLLSAFCLLPLGLHGQSLVTHNIASGNLTIPGSSTNNYVITGTTTVNTVVIQSGYQGTVTLQDLNITSSTSALYGLSGYSCITVEGQDGLNTNLAPVTKVNFILDGSNTLTFSAGAYCALQVNQGAQIHISAVDPNDNNSGRLTARCTNSTSGAAIGGPEFVLSGLNQGTVTADHFTCGTTTLGSSYMFTHGGNVIISGGVVTAQARHAAAIGGGRGGYYDGIILIYGGHVTATVSGTHAAAIGSGCPQLTGLVDCTPQNSTIIVLPPATITATTSLGSDMGLAGTRLITYINDPGKTQITIHTVDNRPNTDIYLDLTETPNLANIVTVTGVDLDLTNYKLGATDALGKLTLNANFQNNTTFFTDATNGSGVPYLPVIRTVTGSSTTLVDIELPLSTLDIAVVDYPSTPLMEGYSSSQAEANAFRVQVSYADATPLTGVNFSLQDGLSSDFTALTFYDNTGSNTITAPTNLTNGLSFYIAVPLAQGKTLGNYSDVLQINGTYSGAAIPAIRRIVHQEVGAIAEICSGKGATFTVTPHNGGSSPSYQWMLNGTPVGGATASTWYHVPSSNGTVTCRMISNEPCASPGTVYSPEIRIVLKGPASVTTPTPPAAVCAGSTLALTTPPITLNGLTLLGGNWTLNGAIFNSSTPMSYTQNGHGLAYVINTDCGTFTSSTVAITVKDKPTVGTLSVLPCIGTGQTLALSPPSV